MSPDPSIGQSTVEFAINFFVTLYLLFFLLRDGDLLIARIRKAVPLQDERQRALIRKFTTVIRATVKGDILVALLQGTLGGLIFWILGVNAPLLWGVLMAFLSLLPAFGASLVWLPVALYFLATGAIWKGAVLIAFGALIIGLVDNFLRPALIGKDTRMPDYVVLISTLAAWKYLGSMVLFLVPRLQPCSWLFGRYFRRRGRDIGVAPTKSDTRDSCQVKFFIRR